MIKIVVADSHPIVHKGIKAYFRDSTEISIVGKALTASELFSCLESKMVDVVVLEMDLYKSDGLAVLRRIKEEQPGVRVLIFSNQPEEVYAISSLKAGASGYINKKEVLSTLRDAILKIASGGVFITNELAQSIAFDESTGRPRRMFKKLSMREVEVLKMLCDGKRNKDIAFELKINEKTVSTYRSRIMKKLLVRNLVELVRKAQSIHIDSF
ncbi:MAG: response regulator transcription factor [Flavobacteriaceae bacterium]|nr:response regulator transcription factor [Flavobacteriaceae bacterium]